MVFETADYIRGNKRTRHVPIIFVTAISKEQHHIFKGYESGAVDYLFKPLDPDILINKVNIFLDLFRQRKIIERKNVELKTANKKIIAQQKELVEEERLKVLLQIAGAAAHELNQPLMILLANIELLEFIKEEPDKIVALAPKIQRAGEKISETIKKIQHIKHDVITPHDGQTSMIDLNQEINVLSVEDSDAFFGLLSAYFAYDKTFNLTRAVSIADAVSQIEKDDHDVILLDYNLPDGTGLDLIKILKSSNIQKPVIAITGKGDEQIVSDFLKAGVYDYLPKAKIDKALLFNAIKKAMEKFGLKKEVDQSIIKMAEMSTTDQLTGLHNRRYMLEILGQEFERAKRYDTDISCLMLDLDHFKQVNDTHGHACGDFVLREFANRMRENKRRSDFLFRYGGEEFMFLLPQIDITRAMKVAEKIREKCQNRIYDYENRQLVITVSIGVSSIKKYQIKQAETLIKFADKALYTAKNSGRNCVSV